jgi:hypothetical protein
LVGTAVFKELSPFTFQHTSWDAFSKTFPAVAALKILDIQRLQSLPPAINRLLPKERCSV